MGPWSCVQLLILKDRNECTTSIATVDCLSWSYLCRFVFLTWFLSTLPSLAAAQCIWFQRCSGRQITVVGTPDHRVGPGKSRFTLCPAQRDTPCCFLETAASKAGDALFFKDVRSEQTRHSVHVRRHSSQGARNLKTSMRQQKQLNSAFC